MGTIIENGGIPWWNSMDSPAMELMTPVTPNSWMMSSKSLSQGCCNRAKAQQVLDKSWVDSAWSKMDEDRWCLWDVYGMFMVYIYIYVWITIFMMFMVYGCLYISMMLNHNLCGLFSRKSLKKTWTLPDLLWTVVPEVGFHVLGHQLQKPAEPQRWLAMVFNMRLQQN